MPERDPNISEEPNFNNSLKTELERALGIKKDLVEQVQPVPPTESQPKGKMDSPSRSLDLAAGIQAARKQRRDRQAQKRRTPEQQLANNDPVTEIDPDVQMTNAEPVALPEQDPSAHIISSIESTNSDSIEKALTPTRQEMLDFLDNFPGHSDAEKEYYQALDDVSLARFYNSTKSLIDIQSESLDEYAEKFSSEQQTQDQGGSIQDAHEDLVAPNTMPELVETSPVAPETAQIPALEKTSQEDAIPKPSPETQKLIEQVEKAITGVKPRITYAGPNDEEMRQQMLKLVKETEVPNWEEVGKIEKNLSHFYGIHVTRGSTTPERHVQALNSLEEALKHFNAKLYKGKNFVVGKDGELHDKNLIVFDPDDSPEVMVVKLAEVINPAPWKKLDARSKKNKPKILEGLDAQYRIPSNQVVPTEPLDLPLKNTQVEPKPIEAADLQAAQVNNNGENSESAVGKTTEEQFEKNTIVTVKTEKIPVGDSFTVKTTDQTYKLEMREDGLYISGDPAVCPEPVKCVIDPIVRRGNPFRYSLESGADLKAYYSSPVEKIKSDKYSATENSGIESQPEQLASAEVKPEPEIPPLNSDELQEKLDAARKAYVVAKRKHDDFSALRTLRDSVGINLKGSAQSDAEKSLAEAKSEYEKARIEFLGADIERHLAERRALVSSHLDEYKDLKSTSERLENGLEKLDKAVKWMGDQNLYKLLNMQTQNRAAKFLFKSTLNLRSAVSALLLGGGVAVGAGSAVGISAFAGRRMLSGVATTFGVRDMIERARSAKGAKDFSAEQIAAMTNLNDVQGRIAQLESRAFSDGVSLAEIEELPEYKLLEARHKELLAQRISGLSGDEEKSRYLENRAAFSEIDLINAKKKEKGARRASLAAGLVAGAVVGSGVVSKAASYFSDGQSLATQFRNLTNGAREELMHNGKATGAYVEYENNNAFVHAGTRGIEGSLQDLKAAEPETYAGMMKWVRNYYEDIQSSDNTLIHRIVTDLAEKNGFTVDGVDNDLSQVDAASLKLRQLPNGEFKVELISKGVDLVGDNAESINESSSDIPKLTEDPSREENFEVINAAEDAPTAPPVDEFTVINNVEAPKPAPDAEVINQADTEVKIGPENIEPESLDFEKLKPVEAQSSTEVSSEAAVITKNLEVEKALQEVQAIPKTSDALEKLLGKDFKQFREDVYDFDGRRLNKIQQETVGSFADFYTNKQTSQTHIKGYKKLYQSLQSLLERSTEEQQEIIKKGTMREMLMRLAAERLKR